jgi:two-component system C4-dicarboxylate transport response regulator DctD
MTMAPGPVLLVEDDGELAIAIATNLRLAGHDVTVAADAVQALAGLDRRFAGVIVSDLRMPGMDGWQFFAALQALDADIPIIFITGHGNIEQAVAALQQGAYDFVAKPFDPQRLLASTARAMEKRRLVLDNRRLRAIAADAAEAVDPFAHALPLAGDSPAMVMVRQTLGHLGAADIDLLLIAEPGCGRERIARLLHDASRRRARAFASINIAAVPPDALAAELFGGAAGRTRTPRAGRLALAERGTLFIDTAETLPVDLQARLLGVLESAEPAPDIRLITAIANDAQAQSVLRPDLLIRLGVLRLRIPPLRERRDDVPLLFGRLAAGAAQRFGQPLPAIGADARAHLIGHDWPGNLRELGHFAERFVLGLATENREGGADSQASSLADRMARVEAGLLREALAVAEGRIAVAMARLALPRKTFYDKLARHGIDPAAYRRRRQA